MPARKKLVLTVWDGFSYVALWQGAGFFVLLLLVWFNELVDVPALFMGRPPAKPDLVRGCLASAGVLTATIVTIGHTYLQQRNIVSGMLTICCYCHKIRINQEVWQRIEEYIGKHSMALFSHGVCPECFEKAAKEDVPGGSGKGVPQS